MLLDRDIVARRYGGMLLLHAAPIELYLPTRVTVAAANQAGARMAEGPEFRTTMHFAYGEPRELAPGVVRIVANNPGPSPSRAPTPISSAPTTWR